MSDYNLYNGNCLDELKKLPDNSVDSIVTDPPYGLGDNLYKRINKAVWKSFNIMLPDFYEGDIKRIQYRDFSFKSSLCSDLSRCETIPIIKSRVAMPESPIYFDGNVEVREIEIDRSTVSSSFYIPDTALRDKIDANGSKFIGNFIFDFGNSIDFTADDVFGGNFGQFSYGFFSVPISSIFSSCFPNSGIDFPFPIFRDGIPDIVWGSDNMGDDSFTHSFALTESGTEDTPVLTFDLTRASDYSSATITTLKSNTFSNFIRPKIVRTNLTTSSLSTVLQPIKVSLVLGTTNGASSEYFLHLYVPKGLLNSISSIYTNASGFMSKKWDYDVPSVEIWKECLRVLKPGGHLLAFAGTRTQHRMAVNIEDAGFEIRDMIAWVYGSGFPKSLDVSKQIDQQEKNRWVKISKAIDNASLSEITELWINSKNANAAGLSFRRKQTEAGLNTQKNGFAHGSVLLQASHKNCDALAVIAELNSTEAHPTSEGNCSSAQSNAESTITASKSHANTAESSPENREATPCMVDFSALHSAWGWQGESRADKLKAVEALKIWLGSNPSSRQVATSALCAALTDDLKLITLSQSKTFLSFGTTRQMACASVISATITESTAASLISFTADTLKSKAIDKAAGAEREVLAVVDPRGTFDGRERGSSAINTNWRDAEGRSDLRDLSKKEITAPATDAARQWQGWGTALKPALEPITVARKPLVGTVANNVLKWGTGAINIDGCRVDGRERTEYGLKNSTRTQKNTYGNPTESADFDSSKGRFPANLILSHSDKYYLREDISHEDIIKLGKWLNENTEL